MAPTPSSSSAAKSTKPVAEKAARKTKESASTAAAAVLASVVVPAAVPAVPEVAAPAAPSVIKPSATSKMIDAVEIYNLDKVEEAKAFKFYQDAMRKSRKSGENVLKHKSHAKKAEDVRIVKAQKKRLNGNPTGLQMSALASDNLNAFLGNPAGTSVKRAVAAKGVRDYVELHGLKQGASAKGFARVDATLAKLFPGLAEIKIFHLMSYLVQHFPLKEKKKQPAAAVV